MTQCVGGKLGKTGRVCENLPKAAVVLRKRTNAGIWAELERDKKYQIAITNVYRKNESETDIDKRVLSLMPFVLYFRKGEEAKERRLFFIESKQKCLLYVCSSREGIKRPLFALPVE